MNDGDWIEKKFMILQRLKYNWIPLDVGKLHTCVVYFVHIPFIIQIQKKLPEGKIVGTESFLWVVSGFLNSNFQEQSMRVLML